MLQKNLLDLLIANQVLQVFKLCRGKENTHLLKDDFKITASNPHTSLWTAVTAYALR